MTASTDNVGVAGYDVYQNGSKINGATIAGTNFNAAAWFVRSYQLCILCKS
ncbi:MAG: hypothetical protein IPG82_10305 [Saprospiraceae bacterium]|nr:hypothetical protein [Saprospiraceae bacterium]